MAGPIPAAAFYGCSGRRTGPAAAQLEEAASRLRRSVVCRPPRSSLLGPAATWRVFPRQAAALEAAAASPGLRLMVFGCEQKVPGGGGKRSYLVCHPSVFWHCDEQKRSDDRCSYEVIRQNATCKLYLDLEFDRTLNPDRDGDAMVELFLAVIATVVEHLFNVKCTRREVIDLCASSKKKFSRHLIFCCKDLVFCDNIAVGNLVRDICGAVRSYVFCEETEELRRLGLQNFSRDELLQLVVHSNNANNLFCDEGVYTKNRNFRVYKSSKFGKRRPLVKSVHNSYCPPPGPCRAGGVRSPEEAFFLASLVSYVETSSTPLEYGALSRGEESSACLMVPGRQISTNRLQNAGAGASPYPDIDAFVRDLVSPGGVRCWHYFDASELLVYDIVGFRFCHNIGRWHRSNNIIIVVSLREAVFYQKCHDPACRGFRSDSVSLPGRLLAWRELNTDWEGDAGTGDQLPDCGAGTSDQLPDCGARTSDWLPDCGARTSDRLPDCGARTSDQLPDCGAGTSDQLPDCGAGTSDQLPYCGVGTADQFPDCGASDTEMLSAAALTELSSDGGQARSSQRPNQTPAAIVQSAQPRVLGPGESADVELDSAQSVAGLPSPDLFPDCGVEDEELATLPAGACLYQRSLDGLRANAPRADLSTPSGDQTFPDCGVEDCEILEELSTEPLPNCGVGSADDQSTHSVPGGDLGDSSHPNLGTDSFPDCGVEDTDLSMPLSDGQNGGPADTSDGQVAVESFPDCGVGDWELCEVGRPAGAAAGTTSTSDTAPVGHTAPRSPDTGSSSGQPYCTAKTSTSSSHEWDDLTDADFSDFQF